MKAELVTETTVYVKCPHCGEGKNRIDHLFGDSSFAHGWGPWSCSECGGKFRGKVNSPTDVEIEPIVGERWVKTFDLLVIPPQEAPVYFIVEGGRRDPSDTEDHGKTYLYGEHTCPTNWLQSVEEIVFEGDDDPHGIADFVRSVDASAAGDDPDWFKVFPEAFETGPLIDGDPVETVKGRPLLKG